MVEIDFLKRPYLAKEKLGHPVHSPTPRSLQTFSRDVKSQSLGTMTLQDHALLGGTRGGGR